MGAVVAYTDPQGIFTKYESLLDQYLGLLVYLHWQPSVNITIGPTGNGIGTAVRTIPSLKLTFVPEKDKTMPYHQIPGLNPLPLMQILVFEVTSTDIYRHKLRQIGKEWFSKHVDIREPTGHAVVLIHTAKDSDKAVKSIWTRMINEFDEDVCLQLNPEVTQDWMQLRQLIQKQILIAFDQRVVQLNSEARKLNLTMDVPGWNFGQLYAVYESLAWAYESLNLFEDALSIYDSLHQMIIARSKETWDAESKTMDSGFICEKTEVVDLMLSQNASYFDVLRHIIARKINMLVETAISRKQQKDTVVSLADKSVNDSIELALNHLPSLVESLKSTSSDTVALKWSYMASKELFKLTSNVGSSLCRGKGSILLVQRDALQSLGCLKGWRVPGIFNDAEIADLSEEDKKDIDFGIATYDEFVEEFRNLTLQSIKLFKEAQLLRTVNRLSEQLVLMYYAEDDTKNCWKTLSSIDIFEFHQYRPVTKIFEIALSCCEKQNLEESLLDLAYGILKVDTSKEIRERALHFLNKYSDLKVNKNLLSTWLQPSLVPYVMATDKGYFIKLVLSGSLDLHFDSIVVHARSANRYQRDVDMNLEFSSNGSMELYSSKFIEGEIFILGMEAKLKKQVFTHDFKGIRMYMKPLSSSFYASLKLSTDSSMPHRRIELCLRSPVEIEHAKVKLTPSALTLDQDSFEVSRFVEQKLYTNAVDIDSNEIGVEIWYDDDRYYTFNTNLNFNLCVSVDFQEHFRKPPYVYLQFLVQPVNNIPIIFCGCEVSDSKYGLVQDLSKGYVEDEMMAFKDSPVSYLFKLNTSEQAEEKECTLKLHYRTATDEISSTLLRLFPQNLLETYEPSIKSICNQLSLTANISFYVFKKSIVLDNTRAVAIIEAEFYGMNTEVKDELLKIITDFDGNAEHERPDTYTDINSSISLTIPNPEADFVHYISLELNDPHSQYVVGEAIDATLVIDTLQMVDMEYKFSYELDRLSDGWSYTGRSRGVFTENKVSEQITLIPNRSGELLLPNVVIRPLHSTQNTLPICVASHTNTKVLVVPEVNMLAITF
ncbi:hypothetical protein DASB73_009490 [Starmerella bacillaris]|uniref:Uncharacterized protein n=1 Tax=Starmerella bacillaris TaxID=1247836 RepID=A0AAV5RHE3_STABA|nr:hypothetical protein DASB73_009490 [Starmerella bacillaris]